MPAFLRRYKKTFLITASLFLVLLSGMGIGYFSSHVWSENGKFETFCREIFKKEVSENMLTLHYSRPSGKRRDYPPCACSRHCQR